MRIALFITCLTDNYFPRAGIAATLVLEHLGHQVEFPQAQTCCAQPMFNNGFHDEARRLARRLIDVLEPYPAVVTPSGSCAAMIRERYEELFHADPATAARARALAARTHEFVEFLTSVARPNVAALGARRDGSLAIHDSCHQRSLGLSGQTAALLGAIAGTRVVPLHLADQCCGFGGTFAVKYPEISGAMVADKVLAIERSGADTVVCADAGCAMNIAGACRRAGVRTPLVSPAEVLAEAMGLLAPEGAG